MLEAQKLLASLGYDPGLADGRADQRTKAAVRQFQRDLGITSTGRMSEELLALLAVAAVVRQTELAEPKRESSGSGFVVSRDGEIVTNHHVVTGCAKATVNHAGVSHDVAVRAMDATGDMALLKAPLQML